MIEMAAAFLLAAISYKFVEQPFLARRYAAVTVGELFAEISN